MLVLKVRIDLFFVVFGAVALEVLFICCVNFLYL